MPTKNPRLTITLEPVLAAQLRRLSEVTGSSQGKLIAELLEGSAPVFERVIQTIEAANAASAEIRGKLTEDMTQAQHRVEEQLGLVLGEFDQAAAPLFEEMEKVERRARKEPKERARALPKATSKQSAKRKPTPLSNRGVRSTPQTPKKPTRTGS
jgi:malonyl CoA-acyl carrier protein transacylase